MSLIGSRVVQKRQFKLPKIELKKFSGKILDWLSWWAQFNKIHEDEELHATDKFQYLIQSMEPNTKGADIVKGFPETEVNYPGLPYSCTGFVECYCRTSVTVLISEASGSESTRRCAGGMAEIGEIRTRG